MKAAKEQLEKLRRKYRDLKRMGLDPRNAVKLSSFEHMYRRLLNAQLKCEADRKTVNNIVEDVQYILQTRFKDLQGDQDA